MWRLLQKKRIHEAFKEPSLDSTRGLGRCVLGQKTSELFSFRSSVAKKEPLTTNSKNKVRVRTSERF